MNFTIVRSSARVTPCVELILPPFSTFTVLLRAKVCASEAICPWRRHQTAVITENSVGVSLAGSCGRHGRLMPEGAAGYEASHARRRAHARLDERVSLLQRAESASAPQPDSPVRRRAVRNSDGGRPHGRARRLLRDRVIAWREGSAHPCRVPGACASGDNNRGTRGASVGVNVHSRR